MKHLIAIAAMLACGAAQAGPDDIIFTQRNAFDTGNLTRIPAHPVSGQGFLQYDATSLTISWVTFGSCFVSAGSVLSLASGCQPVQSDWSAGSGLAQILNKPTTLAGYGITDAYPLSGNPAGFLTSISGAQVTTALGFTPYNATNPAGYITTSTLSLYLTTASAASTYATQAALTSGLAGKLNTPAGTTAQYIRGDGSLATLPTVAAQVINDAPGRTLVTSTAATGFQISASRNARVCYEGTFSTTSTIGGPAAATVFLETADTNSTTPGDWTTKARQTYSNNITLAVVLNQVQLNNWMICRDIPAGKFVRLRVGSVTGTASAAINAEQQETLN